MKGSRQIEHSKLLSFFWDIIVFLLFLFIFYGGGPASIYAGGSWGWISGYGMACGLTILFLQ